jgi:poly-gamma-glutamate synthesis protein (capsule biosynthesis protein)
MIGSAEIQDIAALRCSRRGFLHISALGVLAGLGACARRAEPPAQVAPSATRPVLPQPGEESSITLFLCGDVMTGRGIDQALPHPGGAQLHEPYVRSATDYVVFAEQVNGPIPKPMPFAYPWGDALVELERRSPDARIINLETTVTTSDDYRKRGHIHYRMHPDNVACLTAAGIDCCVLANNHMLDWGHAGLRETLETLRGVGVATAGAGRDLAEAQAPAILPIPRKGRVIVLAFGSTTSGVPRGWAATENRPGIDLLEDLSAATARRIARIVQRVKGPGDVVVASIHWGHNWGYAIPAEQRAFAHALIDDAAIDVVHGHSSHHPKGIEVYKDKPILYGCGDFLNDYEGIGKHREFRGELTLMYFVSMDPRTGRLSRLDLVPLRIRNFRLQRASREEAQWLGDLLDREGRVWGVRIRLDDDGTLAARWNSGS